MIRSIVKCNNENKKTKIIQECNSALNLLNGYYEPPIIPQSSGWRHIFDVVKTQSLNKIENFWLALEISIRDDPNLWKWRKDLWKNNNSVKIIHQEIEYILKKIDLNTLKNKQSLTKVIDICIDSGIICPEIIIESKNEKIPESSLNINAKPFVI